MLHTDHRNKKKVIFLSIIKGFSSVETKNWGKHGLKLGNLLNGIDFELILTNRTHWTLNLMILCCQVHLIYLNLFVNLAESTPELAKLVHDFE